MPTTLSGDRATRVVMFVRNNCINDARVLKEAKSLADNGFEVRVIATLSDTDVTEEKRDGITITRLPVGPFKNPFMRAFDFALTKSLSLLLFFVERPMLIARSRVKHVEKPVFKSEETTQVIDRLREISAFYIRSLSLAVGDRAAVYHGHDLSALWPAYLAARFTGGKVVYDSHELFSERNTAYKEGFMIKTALKVQERFLTRHVDKVITVNQSIAMELKNRYDLKDTPTVIMNCPNVQVTTEQTRLLRDMLDLSDEIQIILYIGGITFNRGLEQTIESLKYLTGPVFVLLGPGKNEFIDHLREHAITHGVADRVIFAPPVPHTDVARFASSADVSVAPIQNVCLSYYYCSPNKLFESIMAGLPVAASDFPEMRAVIEADKVGAVFDPAKPEEIADAIRTILGDRHAYEAMRTNAFAAAHKYSWEKESMRLLELYRDLTGREAPVGEPV